MIYTLLKEFLDNNHDEFYAFLYNKIEKDHGQILIDHDPYIEMAELKQDEIMSEILDHCKVEA